MKNIFERLQKEKDCYKYCRENEGLALRDGDISKAIVYAENATRSLEEINKIEKYIAELNAIKMIVVAIEQDHEDFLRSRI
ncbi:hypothetical protein [Oceanobacillus sp. J11TS1]|uniref:hypothetical protein n=1 Tax=Oceanobacillus sp. J11TS1 TaxID=2807191 RepID=UPI001B17F931|nr:hypothetical protein [Oceanobacillus sp. J11TS1]GIO23933.1 hypothetical protein J11TS1_25140 [Oceanobacillus sp. J11TS1]